MVDHSEIIIFVELEHVKETIDMFAPIGIFPAAVAASKVSSLLLWME